jgi:hypothetical protein
MKPNRRFIIAVDGLNAAQERALHANVFKRESWWHWIDNIWLMTTRDEAISAGRIRDDIRRLSPKARIMVLEVGHNSWATSGPGNAKGESMAKWLLSTWNME